MTKNTKPQKRPQKGARKAARKVYKADSGHKKHIRKSKLAAPNAKDVENNLKRLAQNLEVGEKVKNCEAVAAKLSTLAGLSNGHVWSWNYIASAAARTIQPGKKFMSALAIYLEHFNPRRKQWFYFVRRRSVAAVYDKSDLKEIIRSHFSQMGYKSVTYTRYMEVKHMAKQTRRDLGLQKGK